MKLSRLSFAVVIACLISDTVLAEKAPKPEKPVQTRFASMKSDDPKVVIRVTQPIHAKDYAGGFAKLVLEQVEYRVPAGDYPVRFHTFSKGREWFLVPIQKWVAGRQVAETRSSQVVSGCPSRFTDYLTIARDTQQIEPYGFEVAEHTCSEKGFKRQGSWDGPLVILEAGDAAIVDQAVVESEQRLLSHLDAIDAAAAKNAEAELSPMKRKIGAKLCKTERRITYIAFTEAVSPDLDRIQIRVSAATYGPPAHLAVADFREQILWDDPINWQLCE